MQQLHCSSHCSQESRCSTASVRACHLGSLQLTACATGMQVSHLSSQVFPAITKGGAPAMQVQPKVLAGARRACINCLKHP